MAIGSGLGASFGAVAETTYGTHVAPARFFRGRAFNVKKVQNTQPVTGVAAGQSAPTDEVVTTVGATGQLQCDVLRKDFGLLIAHLMGSTAAPVQQAATAAYLQTHTLGDNFGRSLTIQAGLPNAAGTVLPFTANGVKLTQATFSGGIDGNLEATFDFDAKTFQETSPLAAPSFTAGNLPFHGDELSVRLGNFGSEAAVSGVRNASITISRPMDVERYYAGQGGSKAEPIWNGFAEVSGSLEVDLVNKADFHDRFAAHTSTSLVIEWVGTTAIASTYFPTFSIQCPKVYFGEGFGEVGGPELVKATIPFKAFLDTTNGLAIAKYMSTDLAV